MRSSWNRAHLAHARRNAPSVRGIRDRRQPQRRSGSRPPGARSSLPCCTILCSPTPRAGWIPSYTAPSSTGTRRRRASRKPLPVRRWCICLRYV